MSMQPLVDAVASAKSSWLELVANVDAWYAGKIECSEFQKRSRAIWERIEAAPPSVGRTVLKMIRRSL